MLHSYNNSNFLYLDVVFFVGIKNHLKKEPIMPSVRILVIDENAHIDKEISSCLTGLGYEVSISLDSSGEGIQQIKSDSPDLVLISVLAQGKMDYKETARQIQAVGNIPFVYLIDEAGAKLMGWAALAEADGHLVKPIYAEALHITVERALRKASSMKQAVDSETRFRKIFEHSHDAVFVICPTKKQSRRSIPVPVKCLDLAGKNC